MRALMRAVLVSLGILSVAAQPADWVAEIAAVDMLYAPSEPSVLPVIGNGFLATTIASDSVYVSGLYNGYLTTGPSHGARVPAPLAVRAPGTVSDVALQLREATYYRRSFIDPAPGVPCFANTSVSCTNSASRVYVEQRFYAHRLVPSLLVMEVEVLLSDTHAAAAATSATDEDAPLAVLQLVNVPGPASPDVSFVAVPLPAGAPYSIVNGSTRVAETNSSGLQAAAVLVSAWPARNMLIVDTAGVTTAFVAVIRTTVETPAAQLVAAVEADFNLAQVLMANGTLHSSHVTEWANFAWGSGVDLVGPGRRDVAAASNASVYALLSSVRADRPFGIGPGGLQSGYNMHAFWDMDFWMAGFFAPFYPDVGMSLLRYRFDRIPGAIEKAQSYPPKYNGTMFPWESALTGVETCPSWADTGTYEIHISGDIAVAAWRFWQLSGGVAAGATPWLTSIGAPLMSGIADFFVSRALCDTPGGGADGGDLQISGVIPPDEYAENVTNRCVHVLVRVHQCLYMCINACACASMLVHVHQCLCAWCINACECATTTAGVRACIH